MKNIQMISASAGSGKTYRLIEEIARRVTDKHRPVAPERIMATTFTNKAAAELQERIRMRLLEARQPQAAQAIHDGFIGTVNAICGRLLQEFSFEAGLSPAVEVLPEAEAEPIFNRATTTAIQDFAAKLEPIAQRLGYTGAGSGYGKQLDWRDEVRNVVEQARANAMEVKDLGAFAEQSWAELEQLLGPFFSAKIAQRESQRLKRAVAAAVEWIANGEGARKAAVKILHGIHGKFRNGIELTWADWMDIESIEIGDRGSDLIKGLWEPWASKQKTGNLHLKLPQFRDDIKQLITGVFECAEQSLQDYADYKQEYGLMDFADQETRVLTLIRDNPSFRNLLSERIELLMVDEFQDTSPIQLALFLQLSTLAKEVIWVGDQKQAIYGFRGADPLLMNTLTEAIEQRTSNQANDTILHDSWRSKRALVEFCNAVFTPVFHQLGAEKVHLNIPEKRKNQAGGGWLESWTVEGNNLAARALALAVGIKTLITNRGLQAGAVAVLCRSNDECEQLSTALYGIGLRASVAQGDLLATHECTLALAALHYLMDKNDTVALAEMAQYTAMNDTAEHADGMRALIEDTQNTLARWHAMPVSTALQKFRDQALHLTPLETLEAVIALTDLQALAKAWGNARQRMNNLDRLRAECVAYQQRGKSRHDAATVTGLLRYLAEQKELKQALGSGADTVNVLTYHKAKGLEWPVVILSSLNKPERVRLFGTAVQAAVNFDAMNPLLGRSIRFWPWPYGIKKKALALQLRLQNSQVTRQAELQAIRESQRLLYVGMTRARDGLILAREQTKGTPKQAALDTLVGENGTCLLHFDKDLIKVSVAQDQSRSFAVKTRHCKVHTESLQKITTRKSGYLPKKTDAPTIFPPANLSPSLMAWGELSETQVEIKTVATLGHRLTLQGRPDMADFGNALHGFLGADVITRELDTRHSMAKSLLKHWQVDAAMTPKEMCLASDRLRQFIDQRYPRARIMPEWPMTLVQSNHQRLQGWIDLLLETAQGFVIIDHKSYPGDKEDAHVKRYAPQLAAYKKAVETATAKPVLQTLIHLPLAGKLLALSW